jgi:probable HAF family extracellular repeat protein
MGIFAGPPPGRAVSGPTPARRQSRGQPAVSTATPGSAAGINDSGQIVGGAGAAFVVTDGTQTALPDPPNLDACSAVAINNNGQVLGDCAGEQPGGFGLTGRGVVWSNGTPTVLPTLGGPQGASVTAINNNGQVVGTSQTSTGAEDGFLSSNGTITDLGPTFSPAAINDKGVIVGGQFIESNGTLQNLNTLIPAGSPYRIQSATGINDNGQIIANATDTATGQTHALLLTPS